MHVSHNDFSDFVFIQVDNEDSPNATSLVSDEVVDQEQPKRPWTPSYSVTTQGPSSAAEEEAVDKFEPLPQLIVQAAALENELATPEATASDKSEQILSADKSAEKSIPAGTVTAADASQEYFPAQEGVSNGRQKPTEYVLLSLVIS